MTESSRTANAFLDRWRTYHRLNSSACHVAVRISSGTCFTWHSDGTTALRMHTISSTYHFIPATNQQMLDLERDIEEQAVKALVFDQDMGLQRDLTEKFYGAGLDIKPESSRMRLPHECLSMG